jgi:transcription antitermination factor NusA-like protein
MAKPYRTNETLLPSSIAVINRDGFFNSLEKNRKAYIPLFLSTSIFNLLAEIKAISIPEKKAEKIKDRRIIRNGSLSMKFITYSKLSNYN